VRSADRREGVSNESPKGVRRHRRLDAQHDSAAGLAGDAPKLSASLTEMRKAAHQWMRHSTIPQNRKVAFTNSR
jgi:hypothetical protein